jgi:methyltransferase (TIGR00027 family)
MKMLSLLRRQMSTSSKGHGNFGTALMVAAFRARATASSELNALCNDPFAQDLAGSEGERIASLFEERVAFGAAMPLHLALRTAFFDRLIRCQARRHPNSMQVVILGAGCDTRAARLGDSRLRFFEVDAPNASAEKQDRLRRLTSYPSDAATFVSCDFERQDFLDQLTAAGFDPQTPATFIMEGVTYYLTEPALRATLSALATRTPSGSVTGFDYYAKSVVENARQQRPPANEQETEGRAFVAHLGEPFLFGTNHVLPLLHECGFGAMRTHTFDELSLQMAGSYDRSRFFRFQNVCVAGAHPQDVYAPGDVFADE